jgi:hypothetical protein
MRQGKVDLRQAERTIAGGKKLDIDQFWCNNYDCEVDLLLQDVDRI